MAKDTQVEHTGAAAQLAPKDEKASSIKPNAGVQPKQAKSVGNQPPTEEKQKRAPASQGENFLKVPASPPKVPSASSRPRHHPPAALKKALRTRPKPKKAPLASRSVPPQQPPQPLEAVHVVVESPPQAAQYNKLWWGLGLVAVSLMWTYSLPWMAGCTFCLLVVSYIKSQKMCEQPVQASSQVEPSALDLAGRPPSKTAAKSAESTESRKAPTITK